MKIIIWLIAVVFIRFGCCNYCTQAGDPCPQRNSTCNRCCDGWDGFNNNCSKDIDECNTAPFPCPSYCTNTNGSYRCDCPDDLLLTPDKLRCVNPCESLKCSQRCVFNATESIIPRCSCSSGWQIGSDNTTCLDIDECLTNTANCTPNSRCVNTNGSYICGCNDGYHRINDSLLCTDIDECSSSPCSYNCTNIPGDFYCSCPEGFVLDINGTSCDDKDECLDPKTCDPITSVCNNTRGSFECECMPGYVKSDNSMNSNTCVDVDECLQGDICVNANCTNKPGTYECKCFAGFDFYNKTYCKDTNECYQRPYPCTQKCSNTEGSFQCNCFPGWHMLKNNTCIRESWNDCDQWCQIDIHNKTNCKCTCEPGYNIHPDGTTCEDIDECADPTICGPDQVCVNYIGSHMCRCHTGFKPDWINTGQCVDINECDIPALAAKCSHICNNTEGSYKCHCRSGYIIVQEGECQQVNECRTNNGGCEHACTDTDGSYYCTCKKGWKLSDDKYNCTEISCPSTPDFTPECDPGYLCEVANVSCTEGNKFGNTCNITCGDDYLLIGPNITICQGNSRWSVTRATCLCKSDRELFLSNYTAIENQAFTLDIFIQDASCQPRDIYDISLDCPPDDTGCFWGFSIVKHPNGSSQLLSDPQMIWYTSDDIDVYLDFKIESSGFPNTTTYETKTLTILNMPSSPVCLSGIGVIVIAKQPWSFSCYEYDTEEMACSVNDTRLAVTSQNTTTAWTFKIMPNNNKTWEVAFDNWELPLSINCCDMSETSTNVTLEPILIIQELRQLPEFLGLNPSTIESSQSMSIKNNVVSTLEARSEANNTVKGYNYKLNNHTDILYIDDMNVKSKVDFIEAANYSLSIKCFNDENTQMKDFVVVLQVVDTDDQENTVLYISLSLTVVFVISILSMFLIYQRWRLKKKLAAQREDTVILNPIYSKEFKGYYVYNSDLKVYTDVILGRGNFGKVYLGEARKTKLSINKEEWIKVAVKEVFGDTNSAEYQIAFTKEVKALTMFKHKHIISLIGIGVNAQNAEVYILMDYMDRGALKDFLMSGQKDNMDMEPYHFVYMAAQVADAMDHLESINCIHRDLAARNCLIDRNLFVKVGDLGYVTQITAKIDCLTEYYNVSGKAIPVRWTSPEVLISCKYSVASDVWSFGILFWEIITLGAEPYSGLDQIQVSEAIKAGVKLEVPDDKCCTAIKDLILSCWNFNPQERNSFKKIFREINRILWEEYELDYSVGKVKEAMHLNLGLI